MHLLNKHLLKNTAGPFLFGFVVITFVLIIQSLYRYVDLFVTKGVPFGQASEVLLLSLGYTFALSIPMAVLIGVLMGVGQLASDREVLAMKASGISLGALLRPLLAGALLVTLGLTAYNHFVFPESNHRLANLLYDINRKRPMMEIRAQMFTEVNDQITIHVAEKEDRTGVIRDVRILERTGPADLRPRLTSATWGRIIPRPAEDALQLELHDGEIHDLPDDDDPAKYEVIRFSVHNLVIRNVKRDFESSGRTSRGDREMDLTALQAAAARENAQRRQIRENTAAVTAKLAGRQWGMLTAAGRAGLLARPGDTAAPLPESSRQATHRSTRDEVKLAAGSAWVQVQVEDSHRAARNRYLVEFHKKLAIPVACLVFVLLGLPLALTAGRTGRGVSVTVALAIYLVYYLFLIGGEKLSDRGRLDPAVAMWAANVLLTAIGVPVAVAMVRESPLLPARARRWWADRRGPPRESRP